MPIKRLSIFLAVISCTAWMLSCHKSGTANQVNGYNYPITGLAYIKTYYNNGTDSILLRNKPIFIDTTLGTDTASYFYKQSTGPDGSFTFYIPDTTRKYRIFTVCYDTISSSFMPLYYGAVGIGPPFESNPLYVLTAAINTLTNNGMIIYTVDSYGNILPKVNVILYTSGVIASGDSTLTGAQSFRQVTTDSLGKAFVAAVPGDSIYVSARVVLNNGKDTIQQYDHGIKVPLTGIFYDNVILR